MLQIRSPDDVVGTIEFLRWNPDREDRIVVVVHPMSRADRDSVLSSFLDLGIEVREARRNDFGQVDAPNGRALVGSAWMLLMMPIWVPQKVYSAATGRGPKQYILDGCSGLASGSSGGGDSGLGGPDAGDRSPRNNPPGSGSMSAALDLPSD